MLIEEIKKLFDDVSVEEKVRILSKINPVELTDDEFYNMVTFFKQVVKKFDIPFTHYGTFGTGGARYNTINASTLASIIASCEIPICKVGTTGVMSRWGSANLMELLGYHMDNSSTVLQNRINTSNYSFLYLGMGMPNIESLIKARRIVFQQKGYDVLKILGPSSFITDPDSQVIGVYDKHLIPIVVNLVKRLEKDALIVHSLNGIDELTNTSENLIIKIIGDEVIKSNFHPKELGIPLADVKEIAEYEKKEDQAKVSFGILANIEKGKKRDYVCLSAATLFYISNKVDSIKEGFDLSKELLVSGDVLQHFCKILEKQGDVEKFLAYH